MIELDSNVASFWTEENSGGKRAVVEFTSLTKRTDYTISAFVTVNSTRALYVICKRSAILAKVREYGLNDDPSSRQVAFGSETCTNLRKVLNGYRYFSTKGKKTGTFDRLGRGVEVMQEGNRKLPIRVCQFVLPLDA